LVLMAIPVVDPIGSFQGTLVGELNLTSMWDLVNQLKVGNTGYAYVVDSKGTLIAFKNADRTIKGENVSNVQSVHEFVIHPASTAVMETSTYTGISGSRVVGA
jgi:hypothetical protein